MAAGDLSWPLARAAILYGDEPAVGGLTYAQLARRVCAIGGALAGMGERIGWLGANSLAHLEAWLAVPAFGRVLVDLNFRPAHEELGVIAARGRIDVLVGDDGR